MVRLQTCISILNFFFFFALLYCWTMFNISRETHTRTRGRVGDTGLTAADYCFLFFVGFFSKPSLPKAVSAVQPDQLDRPERGGERSRMAATLSCFWLVFRGAGGNKIGQTWLRLAEQQKNQQHARIFKETHTLSQDTTLRGGTIYQVGMNWPCFPKSDLLFYPNFYAFQTKLQLFLLLLLLLCK